MLCGFSPRQLDELTIAEIVRLGRAWARVNGKGDGETMSAEDFAAINEANPVPMALDIVVT